MNEQFRNAIQAIARGDTQLAESFFRGPGGRRHLENLTLILLHTLLPHHTEKDEMYQGFVEVLNRMEESIRRQKEGEEVLADVFPND